MENVVFWKRRETALSLRAAKRRSNPDREGIHPRLLRPAMCRSLAMTGERCHCEPRSGEAIQTGEGIHPGLLRFAHNDEGRCHCETAAT
ncbi:MAG: hypothetical protein LBT00_05780 [Spirochaetaceae bacterium]|nr:hypothetical protein [Spirochaetaceae bacterium]